MEKKLLERCMKKNFKRKIKQNLNMKKVIIKKDKLYVKWKGYHNFLKSCIDEKL